MAYIGDHDVPVKKASSVSLTTRLESSHEMMEVSQGTATTHKITSYSSVMDTTTVVANGVTSSAGVESVEQQTVSKQLNVESLCHCLC